MLHPVNHHQLVALWSTIAEIAKRGGFWETLMAKGSEYDRVKAFLEVFEDPKKDVKWGKEWTMSECLPGILPNFVGLNNRPYYDPADFSWVPELEAATDELYKEGMALNHFYEPTYYGDSVQSGARWMQGHINAFGSRIPDEHYGDLAPLKACELAEDMPRFSGFGGYPFGHSLYSIMEPGVEVALHTSADNLRVRCHLGLDIPNDCAIEVAGEVRTWERGKVLLLDDSFAHCVWNKSDKPRLILILDFWHPDLTDPEIEAITMLLGKKEVRKTLMPMRNTPMPVMEGLMQLFDWEESHREAFKVWWPNDIGPVDFFDRTQVPHAEEGETRLVEI